MINRIQANELRKYVKEIADAKFKMGLAEAGYGLMYNLAEKAVHKAEENFEDYLSEITRVEE